MNVARAMGNTRDRRYTDDLVQALKTDEDERVQAMAAWALGRLGGEQAVEALRAMVRKSKGVLIEEIDLALEDGDRAVNH